MRRGLAPLQKYSYSAGKGFQTGSTVNVKTAWQQMTTGLAYPISGFLLGVNVWETYVQLLVDVAIGGSGSEEVILENLQYDHYTFYERNFQRHYYIPITIPANTRIACRAQSETTLEDLSIYLYAFRMGNNSPGGTGGAGTDTYGATTSSTRGTLIATPASTYAWGAWSQITASTTRNYKGIFASLLNEVNGSNSCYLLWNLGIGSSGNEEVIGYWHTSTFSQNFMPNPGSSPYMPIQIPSGSRLSIRSYSSNITDNNGKGYYATLHGVY